LSSALGELERSYGSLRLLIALYRKNNPIMLTNLRDEMLTQYGVGRRATQTSIDVCLKLKLIKREIESTEMKNGQAIRIPMPRVLHSLTPKGKKVAKILTELDSALT